MIIEALFGRKPRQGEFMVTPTRNESIHGQYGFTFGKVYEVLRVNSQMGTENHGAFIGCKGYKVRDDGGRKTWVSSDYFSQTMPTFQ